MWQLTRVGGLHRVLACNLTICGLTKVFDFEVILYIDRHSSNGIDCILNIEFGSLIIARLVILSVLLIVF